MVKKKNGFTLIELLTVVALLGILSLGLPKMINEIYKFYKINTVTLELQQESRILMDFISKDLRQAKNSTITIDSLSGQPYYSRINFVTIDNSSVTYYQNGRNITRIKNIYTKIMTKNLRYVAFAFPQSYDMALISVSFTLEQNLYDLQSKALHMASEKVRVMN
ncbi:MAG: prepilin-type N-terminal cleavage/methylation domain-containing protein [Elusimicrobia bacterium]|nr:prepilin-type N-terminal cleavage/methylation domain-containing protein [Elusimicrobiota bacterium]MBU2615383.1 prepilin-type N-terminal cleavage/methylation domain-containing protein [Elusimicrobiota bacterium]